MPFASVIANSAAEAAERARDRGSRLAAMPAAPLRELVALLRYSEAPAIRAVR